MSSVAAAMLLAGLAPVAMKPSRSPTEEPFSSGSSGSLPTEGSAMKAGTTLPSSSTPNSGAAGLKRDVSTPWEPEPSGFTAIWMPLAAVQYCTSGGPNSAVCHHDWCAGGISSGSGMPYGACSPIAHSAARVVRSDAWKVEAAWCRRRQRIGASLFGPTATVR